MHRGAPRARRRDRPRPRARPGDGPAALRELVGAQLQEAELPDRLRVGEALELFASFYRAPADIRELASALGLDGLEDRPFAKLSGGQRQKLSIALALVGNPRVAVLDELTTGLDPAARRDTWALIERVRERGVTIVLVTHSMEEAERLCDRVAVVDTGRVVALGTPGRARRCGAGRTVLRFVPRPDVDDRLVADAAAGHRCPPGGRRSSSSRGSGDALAAVTAALARKGIFPERLRVEQATLEDAFVALTGRVPVTAEEAA